MAGNSIIVNQHGDNPLRELSKTPIVANFVTEEKLNQLAEMLTKLK
ncbi:hypothetical protein [Bacillus solitudinis]|nr:hypothetical protein [Bacillus solitudinis]